MFSFNTFEKLLENLWALLFIVFNFGVLRCSPRGNFQDFLASTRVIPEYCDLHFE
jgi:hypothetical protein